MSGKYNVEVVDSTRYALGEGPYYDPRFKRLSWVDIIGQKVWFIKDGKKECIDTPQPVGAAIPLAVVARMLMLLFALYSFLNLQIETPQPPKSLVFG